MKTTTAIACGAALMMLAGCVERAPEGAAPSAATSPAPPPFKVVGTNKQVMQAITIPSSDVLFAIADASPQSDEQWLAIENAAIALAESGNLMLMPGRTVGTGEWTGFSLELIAKAEAALQAARAKSVDQVLAAGDELYTVCESCHKKYMPQG